MGRVPHSLIICSSEYSNAHNLMRNDKIWTGWKQEDSSEGPVG